MSWLTKILGKDGVTQAAVDPFYSALRISPRPLDFTNAGGYSVAMRSGTLAATLAANGLLFGFQWASSTHLCLIHRIKAQLWANLAFTAAFNDMSLAAHITRSYSVADTAGTGNAAAVLTGNMGKKRTAYQTSQFGTVGAIRCAGTAVISGGTGTDDTNPFAFSDVGKPNVVNAAAATEYLGMQQLIALDFESNIGNGESPHVFAQNEGFRIRNGPVVWPAAGTGVLAVQIAWSEVENARFPG